MRHTRAKKYTFILIAALAFAALPAWGSIIVSQQGATDPALNGFFPEVVTSQGPVGTTAWNVQGSWNLGYDYQFLTAGQLTTLNAATNWAFTATLANLSLNTSPTFPGAPASYGSYAVVGVNNIRFDLGMHSDGSGNQVLWLDPFSATSPNYTIVGLGTNYVTLEAIYNNSTKTADIFVNGTKVISGYAGNTTSFTCNCVAFGGENGNFSQVELQSNPSSAVPEPGMLIMFGSGIIGLAGVLRRKINL